MHLMHAEVLAQQSVDGPVESYPVLVPPFQGLQGVHHSRLFTVSRRLQPYPRADNCPQSHLSHALRHRFCGTAP